MQFVEQMLVKEGRLPDAVIACVGGGSNAIGSFYHFIEDESVRLIGCEAAGRGIDTFETAATIATGRVGIFHGMKSYFCQNQELFTTVPPDCSAANELLPANGLPLVRDVPASEIAVGTISVKSIIAAIKAERSFFREFKSMFNMPP